MPWPLLGPWSLGIGHFPPITRLSAFHSLTHGATGNLAKDISALFFHLPKSRTPSRLLHAPHDQSRHPESVPISSAAAAVEYSSSLYSEKNSQAALVPCAPFMSIFPDAIIS